VVGGVGGGGGGEGISFFEVTEYPQKCDSLPFLQ